MPSAEYGPFLHFEEKSDMTRKSEYSCLPHAAAVAQMQARSVLRQVRVRAVLFREASASLRARLPPRAAAEAGLPAVLPL